MIKRYLIIVTAVCSLLCSLTACEFGSIKIQYTDSETSNETTTVSDQTTSEPDIVETVDSTVQLPVFKKSELFLKNTGETYMLCEGDFSSELIAWGSENPEIATCDNGVVTAVSSGQTTVYAQYNGERVSCVVNCDIKQAENDKPDNGNDTGNVATGGDRDPVIAPPAAKVDASFFDDAVFIGDSISLKLSQYAASTGELGKAKFLVIGSYGVSNAINDHPDTKLSFRGTTYKDFEEALAATGAKKVFIMLGMNDIGLYGIDKTIENWGTMLSMIHEKCPGMVVYIQSMTPVWTGGEKGKLNNDNVNKYNERLKAFAEGNGYKFIDVAPYMKDKTGGLVTKFCSDSYVHLTNEGAQTWIKVLKAYTGY